MRAATGATSPGSWTRRSQAAWTSSSCGTSPSRRPRSWTCWPCSRSRPQRHGRLWAVNDRADIAVLSGAPVFHVGQKDLPVASRQDAAQRQRRHRPVQPHAGTGGRCPGRRRRTCRPRLLLRGPALGHPHQTRPGRRRPGPGEACGREGRASDVPWFAIGGIDHGNVDQVVAAGAVRIVVVRAITDAADPAAAAASLRSRPGLRGVLKLHRFPA